MAKPEDRKIPVMLHLSESVVDRLQRKAKAEARTYSAEAELLLKEALS